MDEDEIDKQIQEIKHLESTNKEKEIVLQKVKGENDVLNDQLKKLQNKLENELEELAADVGRTVDCEECIRSLEIWVN